MSAARLVNTHDQLTAAVAAKIIPKKHALALSRHEHGVIVVWSPFFKTDPTATTAWRDGQKTFFGVGRGHEGHADARKKAVIWVRATYGYSDAWKRNAPQDLVPVIVQDRLPIKQGPRAPAKVDDRVVEVEKNQALWVVYVTPDKIEMAYKIDGSVVVSATWADFKKFFKVVK